MLASAMPKLWSKTIESHRREVRDAILDTTAALAFEHGVETVTMSQIAEQAGVGRATLYKYYPDVGSILLAWHERQVGHHLEQLAALAHHGGPARKRLEAVLRAYAFICHEHHGTALAAQLHRGAHVDHAHHRLTAFISDLLAEGVKEGDIRRDVAPAELASYCLHALDAASGLPSRPAVLRLVKVTLKGLAR